jgi:hypothetical protein
MARTVLESLVADRLEAIRAEIVDLAASGEGTPAERRKRAMALFEESDAGQRMLANLDKPVQGDYSEYDSPTDAIVAYLRRRKRPALENDIIDTILAGGYRGGGASYRYNLDKAIKIFAQANPSLSDMQSFA